MAAKGLKGVEMPRQRSRYPDRYRRPARWIVATLFAISVTSTQLTRAEATQSREGANVHITAERAMRGMLELIRKTSSVVELTPEAMGDRLGLPIRRVSADHFGYAQSLGGGWAVSIERQPVGDAGPRVDLIFSPIGEGHPAATPICTPDFSQFTEELERMGFKRQGSYGEHGRWTYDAFDRRGEHVAVYPLVAGGGAVCVQMVLVR